MADGTIPNAPAFPFETVYNAKLKNSPQYMAGQSLGGLGNKLPDIINMLVEAKKKQQQQEMFNKAFADFKSNKNVSPAAQAFAPIAEASGIGGLETTGPELGKLMAAPKEQMQWRPFPGSANGQPMEINEATGEVRPIQGLKGYKTPSEMTGSGGSRGAFYASSAEGKIQHILDPSLASPSTVIGRSAQSSVRVLNGLDLLNNPNPTDLNALVGDVDSLVSQASATVEGRKMLQTQNLPLEVSKFKAYISTHPNDVTIPDGIKQTYSKILKNLGQFAQARVNNYIDRNAKMARGIGVQTFGSEQAYNDYVKSIRDDYDINARLKEAGAGSTLGNTGNATGGWSYVGKAQ